jgi:hypothetical protein
MPDLEELSLSVGDIDEQERFSIISSLQALKNISYFHVDTSIDPTICLAK